MNIKIKAPIIHNRFDIFKNNIQVAYAENIILNKMWTVLCAGSPPFYAIQYGDGTGTLDASRTTLFHYIGYKFQTTLVDRTYANPTSLLRKSIELGVTEANGITITEVGISNTDVTTSLVTHAMLRDMNGNPISILKTEVDILTIYATLYATIDDTHPTLNMLSANRNGLIRQILGEGGTDAVVVAGQCGVAKQYPLGLLSASLGSTSIAGTWTADVANKRRTLATPKFNVNDGNGDIQEFKFAEIARLVLPASGIYAGLDLSGVSVGSGNGIIEDFVLPSRNVRQSSVVVKVDGAQDTNITKTIINSSFLQMGSDYSLQIPQITSSRFSDDGTVLAIGRNVAPYVEIYDLLDGLYYLRSAPEWPVSNGKIALSGDGDTLAMACSATPYFRIYDYAVGTWTARPDPVDLPSGSGTSIGLSDDKSVVVLTHNNSPYFTCYDWNGSVFVKRANTGLSPGSTWSNIKLSGNGLVMQLNPASNNVYIVGWNGSTWSGRGYFGSTQAAPGGLSYDGSKMVICSGYGGSGIYEWNGSIYTLMSGSPTISQEASIAKDGLFVVFTTGTPYTKVYQLIDAVWTEDARLSVPISSAGTNTISVSPRHIYFGGTYNNLGTGKLFMGTPANTKITFTIPPGLITAEAVGTGDGSDLTFDLDHTPINGTLVVKLDGATTTDYTLVGTTITFNTAPALNVAITADYRYTCSITADYTVDGIHKTSTRVIDLTFTIQYGEPT